MARTASANFTVSGENFNYATDDADAFDRTDVSYLAVAVENHDHSDTRGVGVKRLQTSSAPVASGQVRVNGDDFQWYAGNAAAVYTAVNDTGNQTVAGNKTFSGTTTLGAVTLGGTLSRAADQTIDLTGAATRTLTVQNSTSSQVANVDVDGTYLFRNGTAFTMTLTGTPTANRTLTFPDTTDTVVTLAATQELTNKTLTSAVAKGTWTASGTWTLPAFTMGGAVTATGQTVTGGTFASVTLNTPTVSATGWSNANHTHAGSTTGGQIDAGNLSGSTLAAGVTASSLTSVGVLASPHMTGAVVDSGGAQITAGNLGVGVAPATNIGQRISGSILSGATTEYGLLIDPTFDSSATANIVGISSHINTASASFTTSFVRGLEVQSITKGIGHTITTLQGIYVGGMNVGGTNNYGIYIEAPSGGSNNNVGLYNAGTTQLAGALTVSAGGVTASGQAISGGTITGTTSVTSSDFFNANGSDSQYRIGGTAIIGGTGTDLFHKAATTWNVQVPSGTTIFSVTASGVSVASGTIGIGNSPQSDRGLYVTGTATTSGTTQYGAVINNTATSAATTAITGLFVQGVTAAASYTCSTLTAIDVRPPGKGAGSTITTAYGIHVQAQTVAGTNNYGVYIEAPSGGSGDNIGLYNAGDTTGPAGSTSMTGPFIYIPSAAGAPSGTPTGYTGRTALYYDTTNNKLYAYNGAWKSVTLA